METSVHNHGKASIVAEIVIVVLLLLASPIILLFTHVRGLQNTVGATSLTTITVDPTATKGAVNGMLFGSHILSAYSTPGWTSFTVNRDMNTGNGVWDSVQKRSVPGMVALAKRAGVSVLRWPGGHVVHGHDWKKTVGPILDANGKQIRQKFGLPEFLAFARDVGAQPIIEISEYISSPEDAANLVEYLNSPNNGSNPNGGTNWAAKRAADGHSTPWRVVYFEYGNETYGNAAPSGYTIPKAKDYIANYFAFQKKMRAVDKTVKLGAVVASKEGASVWPGWDSAVIGGDKDRVNHPTGIDFLVSHIYTPWYVNTNQLSSSLITTIFSNSLAAGAETQSRLAYLKNECKTYAYAGRNIPIAVTEFNAGLITSNQQPLRHSLGEALVLSDMFAVIMQPQNGVMLANFHHWANLSFGEVKGYVGETIVKRPQYYVFDMYHNYFGSTLINVAVSGSTYSTGNWGTYIISPTTITYLSANASKSADGNKLYLMVVNKNQTSSMTARINLGSFKAGVVTARTLNGPSVDATNETNPNNVSVKTSSKSVNAASFDYSFAPHSLTALEIARYAAPPPSTAVDASLSAKPASITTGQESLLTWSTQNANSVTFSPSIGSNALSGSAKVKPGATTTYTLTAKGSTAVIKKVTITVGNDSTSVTTPSTSTQTSQPSVLTISKLNTPVKAHGNTVVLHSLDSNSGASESTGLVVTITPVKNNYPAPSGNKVIGKYTIIATKQDGTVVENGLTATVTISYAASVKETPDTVMFWDGKQWSTKGISNVRVDSKARKISFDTTHFSEYAIMKRENNWWPLILIASGFILLVAVGVGVVIYIKKRRKRAEELVQAQVPFEGWVPPSLDPIAAPDERNISAAEESQDFRIHE